jgi:hypothetical protein
MADKIQIRRGLKADLNELSLGEFGYCTDADELFIGSVAGNKLITDKVLIQAMKDAIDALELEIGTTVKKVNGVLPDANGFITIDTSDAGLGDITQLPTADKSNVVNAIKEQSTLIGDKATKVDMKADLEQYGVDVRKFGAVGDGVADDSTALEAACTYAKTNNMIFFIPDKMNCKITKDINLHPLKKVNIRGTITGATNLTVTIGWHSTQALPTDYWIDRISGPTLKVMGVKNADVRIGSATKLLLYANGDSTLTDSLAYSRFTLGQTTDVEIFSEGTTPAWINENSFIGGRITKLKISGNYTHNHNKFINPAIEGATIEIVRGADNIFENVRFEGTNDIIFRDLASNNKFFHTWRSGVAGQAYDNIYTVQPSIDEGVGNQIINSVQRDMEVTKIVDLNSESRNIDLSKMERSDDGSLVYGGFVGAIYESPILPIEAFGFNLDSDAQIFRTRISLFDENKNPIQDDSIITGSGFYYTGSYYTQGANIKKARLAISKKGSIAKYFQVSLRGGNSTTGVKIGYCTVHLVYKSTANLGALITSFDNQMRLVGNNPPSSGYWETDKFIGRKVLTAGSTMGWACTTAGLANNTPWVPSTAYLLGQRINANGKVYECAIAGTSGATAPSHASGSVANGTATFKYVDVLAVFSEYGLISE